MVKKLPISAGTETLAKGELLGIGGTNVTTPGWWKELTEKRNREAQRRAFAYEQTVKRLREAGVADASRLDIEKLHRSGRSQ